MIEDDSTEARLNTLTSDPGTWAPDFTPDTYEYTVNVPFGTTSVNLTPTTINEHATLTIEGNASASGSAYAVTISGSKDVIIEVTAQKTGTPAKDYIVHIVPGCSTENRLSALSAAPGTIAGFSVDGTAYDVTVPYGTSSILLTATRMSAASSMTIDGTPAVDGVGQSVTLTGSPQAIPIVVTSQCGTPRTVTVTVTTTPCKRATACRRDDDTERQLEHAVRVRHVRLRP